MQRGEVGTSVGEIERRIVALGDDRDHGATYLAMEAVRVLAAAAGAYEPGPDWGDRLAEVAGRLAAAKPAMAGVKNESTGRRLFPVWFNLEGSVA